MRVSCRRQKPPTNTPHSHVFGHLFFIIWDVLIAIAWDLTGNIIFATKFAQKHCNYVNVEWSTDDFDLSNIVINISPI